MHEIKICQQDFALKMQGGAYARGGGGGGGGGLFLGHYGTCNVNIKIEFAAPTCKYLVKCGREKPQCNQCWKKKIEKAMIWVARVFTHGDVVFKREAGKTRSTLDTGSQIETQKAKKILYNVQKAFWNTVKTFWLLQPYFGCLSCMPDVCMTRYKFQGLATNLILNQSVVEKLLLLLN